MSTVGGTIPYTGVLGLCKNGDIELSTRKQASKSHLPVPDCG